VTPEERAAEITKGWSTLRVDRHVLMLTSGSDSPFVVVENGGEWARERIAEVIRAAVVAERERCARMVVFCAEYDPRRLPALAGMIRGGFDVADLSGPPKDMDFPPGYTVAGSEQ
jgi:hypothetical protein